MPTQFNASHAHIFKFPPLLAFLYEILKHFLSFNTLYISKSEQNMCKNKGVGLDVMAGRAWAIFGSVFGEKTCLITDII